MTKKINQSLSIMTALKNEELNLIYSVLGSIKFPKGFCQDGSLLS
ncbi:MAG: hypothetical protein WCY33_06595 [Clostridia bacterium]